MKTHLLKTAVMLFTVLFSCLQTAQSQTQLLGGVTDQAGHPLASATVLLLNAADSSLVKGLLGAADASYVFEQVPPGAYRLRVNMLGYQDYVSQPFTLDNQPEKKDLGFVALQDNSALLNDIQVVAKRQFLIQQIDRTVVNVANSITNAGGTALQVLQRSPGVQVNALLNERTLLLSWSNTFGNRKLKSVRQRQTGSAEEMRRI